MQVTDKVDDYIFNLLQQMYGFTYPSDDPVTTATLLVNR